MYRMRKNRKLLLLSMSFILSIVTDLETFLARLYQRHFHDVQMKHFNLKGQQCSAFDLSGMN